MLPLRAFFGFGFQSQNYFLNIILMMKNHQSLKFEIQTFPTCYIIKSVGNQKLRLPDNRAWLGYMFWLSGFSISGKTTHLVF